MLGELVTYAANGHDSRGYLCRPDSGDGPGVIVLQEWWGLVGHIKSVADRLAQEGYVALAPDMYHGEQADSPDDAGKLMMALNIERVAKDLRGATDYLVSRSRGSTLGVVGFCMGGQLALYAATEDERFGACVDFYGIHPNVKPDFSRLKAPVLGLFAERDGFVDANAVQALDELLGAADAQRDLHIYPGVDHAFFNDERSDVYDEQAAQDAWQRLCGFFGKHLRSD